MSNESRKDKRQKQSIDSLYLELEQKGKGGNAYVFRAKNVATNNEVALKRLYVRNDEKEARFLEEINVMKANSNVPGILPIFDSCPEHFWYTMPLAEPLMDWSKRIFASCPQKTHRWDEQDISSWMKAVGEVFIQLAETLITLHSNGVHHRDIKPDNIYFYNNRACLGDFGLVEVPNGNSLTADDKRLGALFTIAPEMLRNPKGADGAKADVYSLAKTLWMVLTGDEKGFDGQYSSTDASHSLRSADRLKHEYLVEIEQLLTAATANNPDNRPDMKSFKETMQKWLGIYGDKKTSEANEWEFITKRIFHGYMPIRTAFSDPADIVNALNTLAQSAALNHMMFPDGGGLDFTGAEIVKEEGFIGIYTGNAVNIIKPKCLYFESFPDARWNYFFLEAEDVEPIDGESVSKSGEQYLVEDYPGHYVCADDAVYGVYDYDSGNPLPEGARTVSRFCRGKFLIVIKTAAYNQIPATYDGRHNVMSNEELRTYFSRLQKVVAELTSKGLDESKVLGIKELGTHPFPERQIDRFTLDADELNSPRLPDPDDFVKKNFTSWNFTDLLPADCVQGKLAFRFEFELEAARHPFTEYPTWYLASDGMIHELKDGSPTPFAVYDRTMAVDLLKNLNHRIMDLCNGYDESAFTWRYHFRILFERIGMPSHLFTKDEIAAVMSAADDRVRNQLVIDEDGYPRIITEKEELSGSLFPVSHESWGGRNNYVGKYSDLVILDNEYTDSLYCWLNYLRTGMRQYCNVNTHADEAELLKEIGKYYNGE